MHLPVMHSISSGQSPSSSQVGGGDRQFTYGSPTIFSSHWHSTLCPRAVHLALEPQAVGESHGSEHFLLMQAWVGGHSEFSLQPATQSAFMQISPDRQSLSPLHMGLQTYPSHCSLFKQFSEVEQIGEQAPEVQTKPSLQSEFNEQETGSLTQPILAVGFGINPGGQEQVAR